MENNPTGIIGRDNGIEMHSSSALPLPGSNAYGDLPQFPKHGVLPFRRTIRRHELHQIVPLAETTIYEMEQRGEFPREIRGACVQSPRHVNYRPVDVADGPARSMVRKDR